MLALFKTHNICFSMCSFNVFDRPESRDSCCFVLLVTTRDSY